MFSVEDTWTMFQRRLMQFPSCHNSFWHQWQRSETKWTIVFSRSTKVENRKKHQASIGKTLPTKGAKFHADTGFFKKKKNRHVNFGILPCVKTTRQKKDAFMERSVSLDMLRQRKSPTKGQRKVVRKDQLHY